MSRGDALSAARTGPVAVPDWLAPAVLLAGTVVVGGMLGSLIRPLFVLGCGAIGWYAWRKGPAAHVYSVLLLFAFAPFARRIVDLSLGFDYGSLMLVGPLLAILVPAADLLPLFSRHARLDPRLSPLAAVLFCIAYTAVLTIFRGNWSDAAAGILKWGAPLVYAAALVVAARRDEVLRAAASAFLVILPVTGLYGIYQYVDPPAWDRYWMQFASILSAGLPVPYGVRTFSTMNGPASYATFTAAGLLLVWFLRPGWLSALLAAPALMGLMLSQYRTAWIALALGILFCLLFAATRRRAGVLLAGIAVAGLVALAVPPFADVIGERIASLGQGGQDDSAQERLEQYVMLWNMPDSSVAGMGFTTTDVGVAGAMAIDGMVIACWLLMGIPVGLICLFSFVWPIASAIAAAARERSTEAAAVGAFALGALAQLPLANLGSGEIGFLFWAIVMQFSPASPALRQARGRR
ncbi:MAG TPA: O-antigen ligase family protein [Mesorhizobium sp.]|nr:O-antigen ligase family protein [Mesorhizobium sp.]